MQEIDDLKLIEIMQKMKVDSVDDLIGLDNVKRMTLEDYKLLGKVQEIPGVIPIEDVVFNEVDNGRNYIVVMGKGTPMNTITVKQFKELAETIQEIHTMGVTHMDIKLQNVVLYNNRINLIDWDANLEDRTDDLSVFAKSVHTFDDKKKADWFRFATLLLEKNKNRRMLSIVEYCLGQEWIVQPGVSMDEQGGSGSWLGVHIDKTRYVSHDVINTYIRKINLDTCPMFITNLSELETDKEGEEGTGEDENQGDPTARRLF